MGSALTQSRASSPQPGLPVLPLAPAALRCAADQAGPRPFQVVSVVSNKGGVGKTTVATNLAIFLRALEEDLPILVVALDDQTVVDRMFAFPADPTSPGVTEALLAGDLGPAIRLGQYGVHYVPSPRELGGLRAGLRDPGQLHRALERSGWRGVVIVDTKSDTDVLVENAVAASDLTLVLVKDHESLLAADRTFALLRERGRDLDAARVLLSLVDLRVKYAPEPGRDILGLLISEIRTRGYPLFETFVSRSTKVESLYTNESGSAESILHHAPGSLVARQLRWLARDVLAALRERLEHARPEAAASLETAVGAARPTAKQPPPAPRRPGPVRPSGQRRLKRRIAEDPVSALGESGLKTVAVDCALDIGDNVDLVLEDAHGRLIGVEVWRRVPEDDLMAVARAIRHRAMVENKWGLESSSTRALLVSHSIPKRVRDAAAGYGVECVCVAAP